MSTLTSMDVVRICWKGYTVNSGDSISPPAARTRKIQEDLLKRNRSQRNLAHDCSEVTRLDRNALSIKDVEEYWWMLMDVTQQSCRKKIILAVSRWWFPIEMGKSFSVKPSTSCPCHMSILYLLQCQSYVRDTSYHELHPSSSIYKIPCFHMIDDVFLNIRLHCYTLNVSINFISTKSFLTQQKTQQQKKIRPCCLNHQPSRWQPVLNLVA